MIAWLTRLILPLSLRRSERAVARAERRVASATRLLRQRRRELARLQRHVERVAAETRGALAEADAAQREAAQAIERLRRENEIYREVTVPALMHQHELILRRYEAEIAVEARRAVAARGSQ